MRPDELGFLPASISSTLEVLRIAWTLETVGMQLREALTIIHEFACVDLPACRVLLATGFNPLHLQPYFHAHLQRLMPKSKVVLSAGLYDDLAGTLARMDMSRLDMSAIVIEWPDLDRRLGFRHLGGWGRGELRDIVSGVQERLVAIREHLSAISQNVPLAVLLPTLDLPPVFYTPSWQLSEAEIQLHIAIHDFAQWASTRPNIRLANMRRIDSVRGFDFKGELIAGLPYTSAHASQIGKTLAQLLVPPQPKKGLITDLDETLWAGIAGEVGVEAVTWDLASRSQCHGLYQQVLCALAEQGVLIVVASKNDPETVEAVFRRSDILLPREYLFPVEAHWTNKADSISRILQAWKVHPDSVVFVDNSESEIAEVKAAYPEIDCMRFDAQNYGEVHALLYRLRDMFAKQTITQEDEVRRESLRSGHVFSESLERAGMAQENFLRNTQAQILFDFVTARTNPRSLELINKTNQFNLNGIRYTESEWGQKLASPESFVVNASYTDKYGSLGVIAVLAGKTEDTALRLHAWAMSCRAFGRRIEHQCLKTIADRFDATDISVEFAPTLRNICLQEFFESILGEKPVGSFRISRAQFYEKCPCLYHTVEFHHE